MCVLVAFSSGKEERGHQRSVEIRRHEPDAPYAPPMLTLHRPREPSEHSTALDHDIEDHDDDDEDLDDLSDDEISV
ncbi:hypothetical protein B5X24_HaOG203835 [Helicoverpa armigera]|nr:hypothetical protein B5X24_HaOG203835 [Helicoverpa armigera]